ncbi:nucleolar protein 8 [Danaus plexippus]|uniref:nucleolar protein 8 n=1 Tax=Danaus plexippus TaxID=13037 RepID=UPI002AAFBDC4|nr:nucleolar protein 8 [Danaus plexippus]
MASATRLFVSNLPENIDNNSLKDIFSSYGEVTNFDLKSKPGVENDKKTFAFVTISASNYNVESCIKFFSDNDFQGHKLYVTRARESFLERLQREREQAQNKTSGNEPIKENNAKVFINSNQNTHKRKFNDLNETPVNIKTKSKKAENNFDFKNKNFNKHQNFNGDVDHSNSFNSMKNKSFENDEKKMSSDKKRLESIKKKRQEFNAKKNIIKTGLISIDKQQNKKVIFSDNEDECSTKYDAGVDDIKTSKEKPSLFDDAASDDEINFDIKEQFEGKKGKKVLDLQSTYKADKRFVLDERFVEDESASDTEAGHAEENVEIGQADEKSKQLDILQNLLGVTIKTKQPELANRTKQKLGMLRFDPSQPEHAKYLAPVGERPEQTKKSKKKKKDAEVAEEEPQETQSVVEKVEVSKEQFYKITDDLKEAITQPQEFSLRSLFAKDDVQDEGDEDEGKFIPIQTKKKDKVKNPLEPDEKNPFVYDSSDSENEEEALKTTEVNDTTEKQETKTVWRENLFFTNSDYRLKDGLLFFTKPQETEVQKDRRELKSLMKKRIYNKDRKNTMFQKKIGGRKKTMKKKFRK